jgi:hypothetical protein
LSPLATATSFHLLPSLPGIIVDLAITDNFVDDSDLDDSLGL